MALVTDTTEMITIIIERIITEGVITMEGAIISEHPPTKAQVLAGILNLKALKTK